MSGTSLDGIDVAVVELPKIRTVRFLSTPYPAKIRERLMAVSNAVAHTGRDFATELRARGVICQGGEARGQGRPDRVPRADDLSRGPAEHAAARRGGGARGADGDAGGLELPGAGHRGGRTGRAARAVCRLPAVPSREADARGIEHRRHRKHHGDSGGGAAGGCRRLRHGSGQHGDRRADPRAHQGPAEFRSRRKDRGGGEGRAAAARRAAARSVLPQAAAQERGARAVRDGVRHRG